jgi:predicted nucleic acid-binding protein
MSHNPLRAVIDTCVLYKPTVRGILFEAASWNLFQPVWSESILAELAGVLSARIPLDRDEAVHRVRLITRAFPDAVVEVKPALIRRMRNDAKDRHVLAAAVAGRAEYVVTENLKDFPTGATAPLGVEAIRPDDFLMALMQDAPDQMLEAFQNYVEDRCRADPHMTVWTALAALQRNNLPIFAESLKRRLP